MTYRLTRQEDRRTQLDRQTWAGPVQLILTYELTGAGEHTSEMIPFGAVFEGKPFFSFGVELAEDETLTDGDFPLIMAGVGEWDLTEIDNADEDPFYLGAKVWFNAVSKQSYAYLFRLSFEGVAVRNTEYFRGN